MSVTITKEITDMSIYGITGKHQWNATVRTYSDTSITGSGKYFATKQAAQAYLDGIKI